MMTRTVEVRNRLGLHARAAARLVRLASDFRADVKLSREGDREEIDGKSILGVLLMAARQGTRLVIRVEGEDEVSALEAIVELFENRFGEDE